MYWILDHGLDLLLFVGAAAACACAVDWTVRARVSGRTRLGLWLAVVVLTTAGVAAAIHAGRRQRSELQDSLAGLTPTYAAELANLGHHQIQLDTPPEDPLYLKLIEKEKLWLRLNPAVNDIYTMRRLGDGNIALIVDAETDYDHDGHFRGDREARTQIGELYPEPTPPMAVAFRGIAAFDDVPYTDRWGTWLSAYAPIHAPGGRLDGIVGVDLDASRWVEAILWARCSTLAFAAVLIVTLSGATALTAVVRADAQQRRQAAEQLRQQAAGLREANASLAQARDAAEAANRELKLLSLVASRTTNGVVLTDPAGRVQWINAGYTRITGYTLAELMGKKPGSVLQGPGTDRAEVARIRELIRAGRGFETELLNYAKDGRPFWLHISADVLGDEHGQLQGFMAICSDVTDRRRSEESLRESTERFELAIRGSNDGIWDWHVDTDELFYSARFKELLGYGEHEFPGTFRAWEEHLHPDDKPAALAAVRQHLDEGAPYDVAYRLRTKTGDYRWFRARAIAVRDADGRARRMVGSISDITALKGVEEELRVAARLDKLTGLPNRALLLDRLQHRIERSRRTPESRFALMFLDFDRFKLINDSLGHKAGDALLQAIADRLRQHVRSVDSVSRLADGDTAARLGGDEFVVLLDSATRPEDVLQVAERLLAAFAQPYRLGEHEVVSTASIGIVLSNEDYRDAEEMLRDADTAMYEAKRSGKGRYVVFDASMRLQVQRRLQLENDLRRASGSDQLSLVYQPIVSLSTGSVWAVEALLRWKHPVYGSIAPAEFVAIAEDSGLILPIGQWALGEACRQMAAWQRDFADIAPGTLSINLSRKQFALATLGALLAEILRATGLSASAVQLEISESVCMQDPSTAKAVMESLKTLGVKLAIDDFGTGFSSLASLHHFPADVLKIDRSFIARVDEAKDIASLVHAVALLARNLGLAMVAEGIEKSSQIVALQELGCEFAQGYFFSEPLPAAELERLLRQGMCCPSQTAGAMAFSHSWSKELPYCDPSIALM
jgi:diguanylate cyclase (GGDEF)-like protein/PAS domain S-box-containing protein